jgi:hypothetical protein
MLTGFEQYTRKRGERYFWKRWSRWCRGANCAVWWTGILALAAHCYSLRRVASIDPMKALRAD